MEFFKKAYLMIASVVDSQAEIKEVLTDLITKSEALGADITIDVADRGTNLLLGARMGDNLLAYGK